MQTESTSPIEISLKHPGTPSGHSRLKHGEHSRSVFTAAVNLPVGAVHRGDVDPNIVTVGISSTAER